MNSSATYTEPVNRIKQRILFDDNLDNLTCLCANWAEYVQEISEWDDWEGVNLTELFEIYRKLVQKEYVQETTRLLDQFQ